MVHQTIVRWALYILLKFIKSLYRTFGSSHRKCPTIFVNTDKLIGYSAISFQHYRYCKLQRFHNKEWCYMWECILVVFFLFIIRPFEKRDVLCRGNVRPSVRLSVRPSVRPRFPDFSSTCFEISIWNLVYTFSRWHDMSSLSCITIGSLWPSLQPKVGQTYFLQSWPHK